MKQILVKPIVNFEQAKKKKKICNCYEFTAMLIMYDIACLY